MTNPTTYSLDYDY